ncbi:MAG: GDP-mannose mannosyl hydrolase [Leptospirillia bacterium]
MTNPSPARLDRDHLLAVVRDAPLVSIDLVVTNARGEVLLGLRNNAPARGFWFVPGGRILKGETLPAAFARIARAELGLVLDYADAALLGVYEHHYDDNFADAPGIGTHYVVLAHRVRLPEGDQISADDQHGVLSWWSTGRMGSEPTVHENSRAYLTALAEVD